MIRRMRTDCDDGLVALDGAGGGFPNGGRAEKSIDLFRMQCNSAPPPSTLNPMACTHIFIRVKVVEL